MFNAWDYSTYKEATYNELTIGGVGISFIYYNKQNKECREPMTEKSFATVVSSLLNTAGECNEKSGKIFNEAEFLKSYIKQTINENTPKILPSTD
ncbi:MAG: hypothetical protein LBL45_02425 [Treponema sp.]|jgi:hypothetical protein|nr:hypothetical protein [Treponema sp.]